MAGRRKATDEPVAAEATATAEKPTAATKGKPALFVLVPFAYATVRGTGEVFQLVKGNEINEDRFTPESVEHLRSIGFVGERS